MDLVNYKNYRTSLSVTNDEPVIKYTDKTNKFADVFDRKSMSYRRSNTVTGKEFGEPTFGDPPKKRNFPACLFIEDTLDNIKKYARECSGKTFIFTLIGLENIDEYADTLKECYDNKITPNMITSVRSFTDIECQLIHEFCGYVGIVVNSFKDKTMRQLESEIRKLVDFECTVVLIIEIRRLMMDELFEFLRSNRFGLSTTRTIIRFHEDTQLGNKVRTVLKCIDGNPKLMVESDTKVNKKLYDEVCPERTLEIEGGRFVAHIKSGKMRANRMDESEVDITTIQEAWNTLTK